MAQLAARIAEARATMFGAARPAEAARVAAILASDAKDRRVERKRDIAAREIDEGRFGNITDTHIGPTPEQQAKIGFEPYTADKVEGTVRKVETVRRVSVNRVKQLHDRGILTDDTYPAVLWYQRQWEESGLCIGASAANWGEAIPGEKAYGMMPRTAKAANARALFRFAREFIPLDMVGTFDRVVLEELTITEAASAARCRYANAAKVIAGSAFRLLGGVIHLLPVRVLGAPGSEPGMKTAAEDLERLRKVEALEAGATTDGEREAASAAAERLRARLDPAFLDEDGFMRPWDEIAAIVRAKVAEKNDG